VPTAKPFNEEPFKLKILGFSRQLDFWGRSLEGSCQEKKYIPLHFLFLIERAN
jgi:hypothetical protein